MNDSKPKIALIQCICPHYRVPFFRKLAQQVDLTLFYGKGEKSSSWQNAKEISGFKHKKLFTLKFCKKTRGLPVKIIWFPALFYYLWRQRPELVITEGRTNIVNNVFTLLYCRLFSVPLIVWDSGRKMSKPMNLLRRIIEPINKYIFSHANAVIAYGSVAKDYFLYIGIKEEKIFIAQNTVDVQHHLAAALRYKNDPDRISDMKEQLGMIGKKILLYVGSLEPQKKVDELIYVFGQLKNDIQDLGLLIIGDGSMRSDLEKLVTDNDINDCLFLGHITDDIGLYFFLCDVCVIPGRGGLAINQAMAYGKPVIVGEADGTEKDMIEHGINGYIINDKEELKDALTNVCSGKISKEKTAEYNTNIIEKFGMDNMVDNFVKAIEQASRNEYAS